MPERYGALAERLGFRVPLTHTEAQAWDSQSRSGIPRGWIQAAGIAAAHGIEMSSHLLPEISAHLLAASPTCHYLEYVDWADAILEEPLQIQDGLARVPDRPGIGLTWRSEAVKALSLDR